MTNAVATAAGAISRVERQTPGEGNNQAPLTMSDGNPGADSFAGTLAATVDALQQAQTQSPPQPQIQPPSLPQKPGRPEGRLQLPEDPAASAKSVVGSIFEQLGFSVEPDTQPKPLQKRGKETAAGDQPAAGETPTDVAVSLVAALAIRPADMIGRVAAPSPASAANPSEGGDGPIQTAATPSASAADDTSGVTMLRAVLEETHFAPVTAPISTVQTQVPLAPELSDLFEAPVNVYGARELGPALAQPSSQSLAALLATSADAKETLTPAAKTSGPASFAVALQSDASKPSELAKPAMSAIGDKAEDNPSPGTPMQQVIARVRDAVAADAPAATATANVTETYVASAPVKVLRVELHPVELGEVTVRLSMKGDVVHVHLEAVRHETAALLGHDKDALAQALHGAGLVFDGMTVAVTVKADAQPAANFTGHQNAQAGFDSSGQTSSRGGGQDAQGRGSGGAADRDREPARTGKAEAKSVPAGSGSVYL